MLVSHRLNGLYFAGLYRNCIQFLPTEVLAPQLEYACCQHGMRAYFIKASELRDRFTAARRVGKTDSCLKYWRPAEIAPKGPARKANCGAKEKAITEFFQILYTEQ